VGDRGGAVGAFTAKIDQHAMIDTVLAEAAQGRPLQDGSLNLPALANKGFEFLGLVIG
jgi:hypothetical protein